MGGGVRTAWQAVAVGLLALTLASLPLVAGYAAAPPGMRFQGLFAIVTDQYSYLTYMEQGAGGAWRIENLFTSEATPRLLFAPFYVLLGKIAGLFDIPQVAAFHGARIAFGAALLMIIWGLILKTCQETGCPHPVFLFAVVCFSSGLGWLFRPFGFQTMDLWGTEMWTFSTLTTNPHVMVAQGLLVVTLILFQVGCEKSRLGPALLGGMLLALAAFVLPYTVPLAWAILFGYGFLLACRRQMDRPFFLKAMGGILLVSLPAVIFQYRVYRAPGSEYLFDVPVQLLRRPDPLLLLGGLGLLLPAAVYGIALLARGGWLRGYPLLLSVWLGVAVGLSLLPAPMVFQARMLNGIGIPLALLGGIGVWQGVVYPLRKWGRTKWLTGALVHLVLGLTDALVLLRPFLGFPWVLSEEARRLYERPLAFSDEEREALTWLREEAPKDGIVLSGVAMGSAIPAFTLKRVVAGHISYTIDFEKKKRDVQAFFDPAGSASQRFAILSQYKVDFAYYGPEERKRAGPSPVGDPHLERVFGNAAVHIYRVRD